MNNPFDLENYKRQITMHKENTSLKSSYQQTAVVNRERAKGIEPSLPYSKKAPATEPEKFVADMPVMKKYNRDELRKQARRDKKRPLTLPELEAKWNAQSDRMNQWSELGMDEIVWYAQTHNQMEKDK
jgi:hypothetical protein